MPKTAPVSDKLTDEMKACLITVCLKPSITKNKLGNFLKALKTNPEEIISWVESQLLDWLLIGVAVCDDSVVVNDFHAAAIELVEECKIVFSAELSAI
jgi:hypothetical protein